MTWQDYIPEDVRNLFEIHYFRHAACILASEFPEEFGEILDALRAFRITTTDN
jgi:hypothetical protein